MGTIVIHGVGVDIVDNARMQKVLQRQPKIVSKILTPAECADLNIDDYSDVASDISLVQSVAARFAVKEATVKSLHLSLFAVGLQAIEVLKDAVGAPSIKADFSALGSEMSSHIPKNVDFLCSLSHSEASSVAVVIAQS